MAAVAPARSELPGVTQQAAVFDRIEHLATPAPIARRTGLSAAQFRADYLLPRRPVILTDAAAQWPLLQHGGPDYFRRVHGAKKVRFLGSSCRLDELLDRLEESSACKPAPYPCKFEIARDFRELLDEVSPRFAHSLPDRQGNPFVPARLFDGVNNLEIFFGGRGGKFPYLHYDVLHLHAWITQLHGDKEFVLYAPGQEHLLYVDPRQPWRSTVRGHHAPDPARYPLLREARAQSVVIHAGETLFLPCGWWHTARSLTFTISVAFDQLGPDNWRDFAADAVAQRRRDGKRARALALRAGLAALDPLLMLAEAAGANRRRRWGDR